jgi:hypothetical protein
MVNPSKLGLHFSDTGWADILAFEMNNLVCLTAENTSRFILLQNDAVTIDVDFQCIFFSDAECTSQLDGNHHTAELIHFANDTC